MTKKDDQIIAQAIAIIEGRFSRGIQVESPSNAAKFLQLKLAERPQEVFAVMFLDSHHRLIEYREMFQGTIDAASVYPREIARVALELNAAAVIFSHNHPSGCPEQSIDDQRITRKLQEALRLFEIRVLDHIVVGMEGTVSFSERGLL